jgi:hypothetical protein
MSDGPFCGVVAMHRTRFATALLICAATALAPQAVSQETGHAALPDWSGLWTLEGGTVFDRATVQPPEGRAGSPGVREYPPYNEEWEARYLANIERVNAGTFPDPISQCGTPHGFPRLLNLPDAYEFAVTPQAVYVIVENGPNILRIYTDGRAHPPAEELWPTYNGASVGHWEGDTLVFTTISMKGARDDDVILDRTGLVLSDAAKITTRLRKIDEETLEARLVIEDEKALTAPWHVTKRYRKLPPGSWAWDYACAENNRNPVTDSGRTLTLGPDGQPIDRVAH